MERGARNRNASEADGLQVSDGRERARTTHLDFDAFEYRLRLPRRIFEGDGPARGLGGPAERFLLRDGIDFGNHAVYFVRQRLTLVFPFADETEQLI